MAPVSEVSALHRTTTMASARRGPMRSASHPAGICAAAYPSAKALKTRPICASESERSPAIGPLAEEIAARSM